MWTNSREGKVSSITMAFRFILPLLLLILPGTIFQPTIRAIEPAEGDLYFELVTHYAPVWYQDTAGGGWEQDCITRFNFDGDWIGNNNWENQPNYPLEAYIYYGIVETETHWFITYADFHPRDWSSINTNINSHENDMEGAHLVVKKDGTKYGAFVLMETQAHGQFYQYTNDQTVANGNEDVDGQVLFFGGTHPILFVEEKGHGVYAYDGKQFDGIKYYYTGTAQIPEAGDDLFVGYALEPVLTTLWPRRYDVGDGHTFDKPLEFYSDTYGSTFDGETYGDDKANPPWGWDDMNDQYVNRGDLFLNPAYAIFMHMSMPAPYSLRYLFNPYVDQFDHIAPEITLNSPENNSLINPGQFIDLDVQDLFLETVTYSFDGAHPVALWSPFDLETTHWDDGFHVILIHAEDSRNNVQEKQFHFTVDGTPPEIRGVYPLENEEGVDITVQPGISFSENINETTLNSSSFFITDPTDNHISGTVIFDQDNLLAIFTPYDDFSYSTSYHVTVAKSISDVSGLPLASELIWSFSTIPHPNVPPAIQWVHPTSNVTVSENATAVFTVNASDANGDELAFRWYLNDEQIFGSVNETFLFCPDFEATGTYLLTVRVFDIEFWAEHEWEITVTDVNRPPQITLRSPMEDLTVYENVSIILAVQVHDPDSNPLSYQWYIDDKLQNNITYDELRFHTGLQSVHNQSYRILLIVSDGEASVTTTWNVTVLNVNHVPVLQAFSPGKNIIIQKGAEQEFSVTASDLDNDALVYQWFMNDAMVTSAHGQTCVLNSTDMAPGWYHIGVIITDGSANISLSWNVTIKNIKDQGKEDGIMDETEESEDPDPSAGSSKDEPLGKESSIWWTFFMVAMTIFGIYIVLTVISAIVLLARHFQMGGQSGVAEQSQRMSITVKGLPAPHGKGMVGSMHRKRP